MKKSLVRVVSLLAAVLLVASACGGGDGAVEVEDARFRIATESLGAGYLSLTNGTDDAVTLQAASAPGVDRIELHESSQSADGTMKMEQRPNGFVVPAGESITLQPGGLHLMMFGELPREDMTITLDFGDEQIEVVASFDADASAQPMSAGDMDHGDMDHDAMDSDDDAMDHSDMDHGDMDHDAMDGDG